MKEEHGKIDLVCFFFCCVKGNDLLAGWLVVGGLVDYLYWGRIKKTVYRNVPFFLLMFTFDSFAQCGGSL